MARIALDNDLNANLVRRWISLARNNDVQSATPGFVPVNLPALPSMPANRSATHSSNTIRIEIPRASGAVVVEWPAEQAHQGIVLLRDLLA